MSVYSEPLDWIKQSIDSILNQTFSDFEFIIINDKPDRPELGEFLSREAENDSRIKVYTNEKNIGLTKSLNVGLKLCRGEYIARMDADDISLPERFAKQVAFMDSHPNVIVCGTNIKLFGKFKPFYIKTIFQKDEDIRGQMFHNSGFVHPTVFIRKRILEEKNITYDENFRNAQDYKLWYDLSNAGQFANLPESLLRYRLSEQQITSKNTSSQQSNRKKITTLFKKYNLDSDRKTKAYLERSEAYAAKDKLLFIKSALSPYTSVSIKERISLLLRSV